MPHEYFRQAKRYRLTSHLTHTGWARSQCWHALGNQCGVCPINPALPMIIDQESGLLEPDLKW